jgi:hypothetical protein
MRCGDNPYLVAFLAKNIQLVDAYDGVCILKWSNPDRLVFDMNRPHHILEKIPGAKCQAPIHLPLLKSRDPASRADRWIAEKTLPDIYSGLSLSLLAQGVEKLTEAGHVIDYEPAPAAEALPNPPTLSEDENVSDPATDDK